MGKFGKKVEVKLDPLAYNIGLLGESGIGKSTVMKEVCEKLAGDEGYIAFDIGREDGHDAINGIVSEKIENWQKFAEVVDDIIDNKEEDYPNLKIILIDTYDELMRLAEDEAIRLSNIKSDKKVDSINAAFGGFGRGQDKAIDLVQDKLWELKKVGVAFMIVAHTKKKDMEDIMTEDQYSVLTSNCSQKYFNAIKTKLHFLGLAYIDREIVKQKTGKQDIKGNDIVKGKVAAESRVINFRDDTYSVDSKSRFADIVDKIPLNADAFIAAMQDAIKAEFNKGGGDIKKAEKAQAKEAEKSAKENLVKIKAEKAAAADAEKRAELSETIKLYFNTAPEAIRAEFKAKVIENGCTKFSDEGMPIAVLEEMVATLKNL